MEIEIELPPNETAIESQIHSLCIQVIRVENRILCVPDKGKLVEIVLLLMRNKVNYQLKNPGKK